MPITTDLHQHAWPADFLTALEARHDGPRTERTGETSWTLRLPNEPDCQLGEAEVDADWRRGGLFAAGIDRALLVPPLAIGIDSLPADDARELLAAWHDASFALGRPFGVWGAVAARDPRVADLEDLLARGAVGLSVPASAIADAASIERFGPVLEALQRAGRPLFVHPAPPADGQTGGSDVASWWPAVADYPGQLLRAWATWLDRGMTLFPDLRVGFAALAGGGPLMLERLAARGGPVDAARSDRLVYETSSFGARAIAQAAQAVGVDRLAFGSDRPVVAATDQHVPLVAGIDRTRLCTVAAERLLDGAADARRTDATERDAPLVLVADAA
ncbi:MAG: hypothetical protein WC558_06335 [Patulibacter sp.]